MTATQSNFSSLPWQMYQVDLGEAEEFLAYSSCRSRFQITSSLSRSIHPLPAMINAFFAEKDAGKSLTKPQLLTFLRNVSWIDYCITRHNTRIAKSSWYKTLSAICCCCGDFTIATIDHSPKVWNFLKNIGLTSSPKTQLQAYEQGDKRAQAEGAVSLRVSRVVEMEVKQFAAEQKQSDAVLLCDWLYFFAANTNQIRDNYQIVAHVISTINQQFYNTLTETQKNHWLLVVQHLFFNSIDYRDTIRGTPFFEHIEFDSLSPLPITTDLLVHLADQVSAVQEVFTPLIPTLYLKNAPKFDRFDRALGSADFRQQSWSLLHIISSLTHRQIHMEAEEIQGMLNLDLLPAILRPSNGELQNDGGLILALLNGIFKLSQSTQIETRKALDAFLREPLFQKSYYLQDIPFFSSSSGLIKLIEEYVGIQDVHETVCPLSSYLGSIALTHFHYLADHIKESLISIIDNLLAMPDGSNLWSQTFSYHPSRAQVLDFLATPGNFTLYPLGLYGKGLLQYIDVYGCADNERGVYRQLLTRYQAPTQAPASVSNYGLLPGVIIYRDLFS